jgi:hypothetical protein
MSQTQVVVPSESKQEISPGDKLYDESRKQLLDKVGKLEINTGTIITILRFAMEVVEATQLKGPAQR